MTVYSTLYDGLQGGVESIKAPTRIQPRTLLWFLFHRNPQNTLVEKLGEHAGYMLENYLTVADILHQQLSFCFSNPNSIASQHEQPCATISQQNYFIMSITLTRA